MSGPAACSECPAVRPVARKFTCGAACWKARCLRLRSRATVADAPPKVEKPKPREWPAFMLELQAQVLAAGQP